MPQIAFPKNRRSPFEDAPLADLLAILLRQFRRPLAAHDLKLSDADCEAVAAAIVTRANDPRLPMLRTALRALTDESEGVLRGWGLSFAQSLATSVEGLPNWGDESSTAEFLDLAGDKSNAELRISAGAALRVALGDYDALPLLLARLDADRVQDDAQTLDDLHAADDLDATIARRVLRFAAGVEDGEPNADDQARGWAEQQR